MLLTLASESLSVAVTGRCVQLQHPCMCSVRQVVEEMSMPAGPVAGPNGRG